MKQHHLNRILVAVVLGLFLSLTTAPLLAEAQYYGGPGIAGGVNDAGTIAGVTNSNLRSVIINVVHVVLSFLALVAVIVIVIAGIILITSQGDDSKKDTARKAIIYALAGLIVILLAEAVVLVFVTGISNGGILGTTDGVIGNNDIRGTVLSILFTVLSYMALIAVIMIVIAGIYLVISNGDEQAKEKAKKIILYVVAGLIVILLASAVVWIFANAAN